MAIARKIDPAALARAFADEISAYPEIKRVWYWYRPNSFDPEQMSLDFTIQVAKESKTARTAIVNALTRIQTEYFDALSVGSLEFALSDNAGPSLDDLVSPDAIEIPLRGA